MKGNYLKAKVDFTEMIDLLRLPLSLGIYLPFY